MNIAMAKMKMEKRTGDVIIKIDNGGEQNFKSGSPDGIESVSYTHLLIVLLYPRCFKGWPEALPFKANKPA